MNDAKIENQKNNKVIVYLTVIIWIAVIVFFVYYITQRNNKQNDLIEKTVGSLNKTNKTNKAVSQAFSDDTPYGYLNSSKYVNKILPNLFTNWDEKHFFSHFSNSELSKQSIAKLKTKFNLFKTLGKYQKGRITDYKRLDEKQCAYILVDATFENESKVKLDFIIIEEDKTMKIFLFRIRAKSLEK